MDTLRNYIPQLDVIRCIAILLVIVQHAFTGTADPFTLPGVYVSWIYMLGHMGVPLFIALSGYLYLNPQKSIAWGAFWKDKLLKIGIPFLIALAGYFLVLVYIDGTTLTSKEVINKIYLVDIDFLYFIPVIFGLYLITPLIRAFNRKLPPYGDVSVLTILFILTGTVELLLYMFGMFTPILTIFLRFLRFLAYYYAGYVAAGLVSSSVRQRPLSILAATLFILASIAIPVSFFWKPLTDSIGSYALSYSSFTVVAAGIVLFMAIQQSLQKISLGSRLQKITYRLARDAFPLYLLHWFVMHLLDRAIPRPQDIPVVIAVIGIKVVIAFVVSWGIILAVRGIWNRFTNQK